MSSVRAADYIDIVNDKHYIIYYYVFHTSGADLPISFDLTSQVNF
jgi:hypothetical protein